MSRAALMAVLLCGCIELPGQPTCTADSCGAPLVCGAEGLCVRPTTDAGPADADHPDRGPAADRGLSPDAAETDAAPAGLDTSLVDAHPALDAAMPPRPDAGERPADGDVIVQPDAGCPDVDQDNVCDDIDNCPGTPNADQGDIDRDGVGDACDVAPPVCAADIAQPVQLQLPDVETISMIWDGAEVVIAAVAIADGARRLVFQRGDEIGGPARLDGNEWPHGAPRLASGHDRLAGIWREGNVVHVGVPDFDTQTMVSRATVVEAGIPQHPRLVATPGGWTAIWGVPDGNDVRFKRAILPPDLRNPRSDLIAVPFPIPGGAEALPLIPHHLATAGDTVRLAWDPGSGERFVLMTMGADDFNGVAHAPGPEGVLAARLATVNGSPWVAWTNVERRLTVSILGPLHPVNGRLVQPTPFSPGVIVGDRSKLGVFGCNARIVEGGGCGSLVYSRFDPQLNEMIAPNWSHIRAGALPEAAVETDAGAAILYSVGVLPRQMFFKRRVLLPGCYP